MASFFDKSRELLKNLKQGASTFTQYTLPQKLAQIASNPGLNNYVNTVQTGRAKYMAPIQQLPRQAQQQWGNAELITKHPILSQIPQSVQKPLTDIIRMGPAPFMMGWANAAAAISPNSTKNPLQRASDISAGIYQGTNPFKTMFGGVMGMPLNFATNAIGNVMQGKPLAQNYDPAAAYQQGFQFQSKLGPIENMTSPVTGPLLNSIFRGNGAMSQITKSGLQSGIPMGFLGATEDAKNGRERLNNVLSQLGQGFVFGAGSKAAGIGLNKFKDLIHYPKEIVGQLRDARGRWTIGDSPIKPPKMPQKQWEFQIAFNEKYNRNPYTPVYTSDLAQAVNYEAGRKVGNQARDVNVDKNPLNAKPEDLATNASQQSLGDISTKEISRVADNLQKYNVGLSRMDAEAMANDVITNRPFNKNLKQGGLSEPNPMEPRSEVPPSVQKPVNTEKNLQPQELKGLDVQRGQTSSDSKIVPERTNLPASGQGQSSGKIIPQDKYAFSVNKGRLNIDAEAKTNLESVTKDIKPQLESVKGKKLSNEEVLQAAGESQILRKIVDREDTLKATAAITRLRQKVASGASSKGVDTEFIDNLRTLNSIAADTGRRLKAFDISADPIGGTGLKEELVSKLLQLGKTTEDIIKASENVDFNNPKQVTEFWRKFVKPNIGEVISEYRYMNLLSSPKTHITNAFSNALQAIVVSPVTKLYSGVVDTFGSAITGKQKQHYVSEVPAYYKGMFSSVGDAFTKAADAFKGNTFTERPDVGRIPTNSKLTKPFQTIPRALEASDVFFRSLISAGEKESLLSKYTKQGKTVNESVIQKLADEKAQYFVFRKALDPANSSKQGHLLSYIDKFTSSIYQLRKVPGVSWFIPFVQTPMNILKQGIEYSPLGITTLPGAADKTEQLSKTLVGSTVFAGAAWLSQVGDSTWAAPTSEKGKEDFYASGRQPYSIKIGDQWVSYSRLGPLAYPIAMASAIKYYTQQDPKALTRTKGENLSKVIGGLAKFFSDQSYMQGIGDLVKTVQGDTSAAKQTLANIPSQLIPLSALTGWVARILDPIYRRPGSVVDSLKSGIPGLSTQVAPYTNPAGLPSRRENVLLNAVSPVGITPQTQYEGLYNTKVSSDRYSNIVKEIKDKRDNGDIQGAMEVLRANRDVVLKGGISNKENNAVNALQEKRDKVAKSNLPEDQKQRLYKMIERQIVELTRSK